MKGHLEGGLNNKNYNATFPNRGNSAKVALRNKWYSHKVNSQF